jgi:hypothetical protein
MRNKIISALFTLIAMMLLTSNALGQDKPNAVLRVNEDMRASSDRKYYVEISVDVPLNARDYDALKRKDYAYLKSEKHYPVGVLASKGKPLTTFPNYLEVSPDDPDPSKPSQFRIYIPQSVEPFTGFDDSEFSVLLPNYYVADDDNQPRGMAVSQTFTRKIATNIPQCQPSPFGMTLGYKPSNLYSFERARQIYAYVAGLNSDPAKLAKLKIKVEPLTQAKTHTLGVRHVTLYPDTPDVLGANDRISVCFDTDRGAPTEGFDAELAMSTDAPKELLEPTVVTGLEGLAKETSPVVFVDKEKPVGLRPIDKDLNIAGSLVSSVADVKKDDKMVRERTTRGTLDLRVGLFRSTERVFIHTSGNIAVKQLCGEVPLKFKKGDDEEDGFKPATAAAPGYVVIIAREQGIAPGVTLTGVKPGSRQCLYYKYLDSAGRVIGRNPSFPSDPPYPPFISDVELPGLISENNSAAYSIFTPFYIDAKVSTGKIVKDTLSLNRIVFGTQEELRYYPTRKAIFPTYYRFIFQGNNASDRDFKQAEYKGTFEFRPVFGPLNHPLDAQPPTSIAKEIDKGGKPPFKLIPITHGFEFVPLIGAELGRTYLRRRPAADIKPSDTVRRLYFGLDTVLNPTAHLALKTSEIFYIRGESKTDRYHNYFLGEVSYGLGEFINRKAAHSLFFSWERGGQPPFDDPDVNALKFGYRVTAATIFSRNAPK